MDAAVAAFGAREAYVDGTRRITFAEWIDAADGVAGALAARGVKPGDVVAIALPPSIDYAIAYAAIVRAGAVASGLNLRLGPREVTAICACAPPVLAFVDERAPLTGLPDGIELVTRHELAAAARGAPVPRAARTIVGSGRDHLDQRHHRRAEGRVVRPRQPARPRSRPPA